MNFGLQFQLDDTAWNIFNDNLKINIYNAKDYHVNLKKNQVFRMFRINQFQRLTFHLKRNIYIGNFQ